MTGLFLLVELLALVAISALGFWNIKRPLLEIAAHPVWLNGSAIQTTPLAIIGLATSVAIFAYSGYGSAVYFAEEMHEARTAVAKTILWALVITVITELVPVTAVLMGAPDLKAFFGSRNPSAPRWYRVPLNRQEQAQQSYPEADPSRTASTFACMPLRYALEKD